MAGIAQPEPALEISVALRERKRILDKRSRALRRSESAASALSKSHRLGGERPVLVAPKEEDSTPPHARCLSRAHLQEVSAFAKRAPSICSLTPCSLPAAAMAATAPAIAGAGSRRLGPLIAPLDVMPRPYGPAVSAASTRRLLLCQWSPTLFTTWRRRRRTRARASSPLIWASRWQ